jgi:hypothetical protein
MKRLVILASVLILAGCSAASQPLKPVSEIKTPVNQTKVSLKTAQEAADAVYRKVGTETDFASFPQTLGTEQRAVNIGGQYPGVSLPVAYATSASPDAHGGFDVTLVRSWAFNGKEDRTSWTFKVGADGTVQPPVRIGNDLPNIR